MKRIFRGMFISIIVCLCSGPGIIAGVPDKRVTFTEQNASSEKIFKLIEKQSDYRFVHDPNILKGLKKINLAVCRVGVREVMNILCTELPLEYEIVDKVVFVYRNADERGATPFPQIYLALVSGLIIRLLVKEVKQSLKATKKEKE